MGTLNPKPFGVGGQPFPTHQVHVFDISAHLAQLWRMSGCAALMKLSAYREEVSFIGLECQGCTGFRVQRSGFRVIWAEREKNGR